MKHCHVASAYKGKWSLIHFVLLVAFFIIFVCMIKLVILVRFQMGEFRGINLYLYVSVFFYIALADMHLSFFMLHSFERLEGSNILVNPSFDSRSKPKEKRFLLN